MKAALLAVIFGASLIVVIVSIVRLLRPHTLRSLKPMRSADDVLPGIFRGPLLLWTAMFVMACLMLLLVSGITLFYAFAIFHGEVILLLQEIPLTPGNVVGHICYPAIVLVMAIFLLVLFGGMVSMLLGEMPALGRLGIRMRSIPGLVRLLLMLLAVAASLEIVKIISLTSTRPSREIAGAMVEGPARLAPLPIAVVVALMLLAIGLWIRWSGRR